MLWLKIWIYDMQGLIGTGFICKPQPDPIKDDPTHPQDQP